MTEKERQKKIKEVRQEFKELEHVPKSDWHAGFEALLRIEIHGFGNKVRMMTEMTLGTEPPRADYVILIEDEKTDLGKDIFKIFRKYNVLEYKNPRDSLNERVLRKICGYGNFFIGVAEHEGDVSADQVTLSIFRHKKNPDIFSRIRRVDTMKSILMEIMKDDVEE